VTALAMLDFETYLVSILDRQDKMSMATSIESRVPFLDNEVIDLARSLPLAYRQTLRHRKRVLKEVALRYLPPEIVHRRKSGFGVTLPAWFAGTGPASTLLDEAVSSQRLAETLDGTVLRRLVQEHRGGAVDHSDLLWSAVNLHVWQQVFEV
jgi:asparagine synthase (glutamine-hydrolysing)